MPHRLSQYDAAVAASTPAQRRLSAAPLGTRPCGTRHTARVTARTPMAMSSWLLPWRLNVAAAQRRGQSSRIRRLRAVLARKGRRGQRRSGLHTQSLTRELMGPGAAPALGGSARSPAFVYGGCERQPISASAPKAPSPGLDRPALWGGAGRGFAGHSEGHGLHDRAGAQAPPLPCTSGLGVPSAVLLLPAHGLHPAVLRGSGQLAGTRPGLPRPPWRGPVSDRPTIAGLGAAALLSHNRVDAPVATRPERHDADWRFCSWPCPTSRILGQPLCTTRVLGQRRERREAQRLRAPRACQHKPLPQATELVDCRLAKLLTPAPGERLHVRVFAL